MNVIKKILSVLGMIIVGLFKVVFQVVFAILKIIPQIIMNLINPHDPKAPKL